MKRALIIAILLSPVLLCAQSLKYAIFGASDDTSTAVVIDQEDVFAGLVIPDDIDADSLSFLVSRDGTNYYPLHEARQDSAKIYYVKVDTTQAIYLPLDTKVFFGIRRLQIILNAASSASSDTVEVVYKSKPSWWRF